jgi:hypothetical protein
MNFFIQNLFLAHFARVFFLEIQIPKDILLASYEVDPLPFIQNVLIQWHLTNL